MTDAKGIPLAVAIDGANRHDMKRVRPTLESLAARRPPPTQRAPQRMCLDKGYDYDEVRALVEAFGFTAHIRSVAKKPERSGRRQVSRHDAGALNVPIAG